MINVLHLRDTDRVCGPGKTMIETACAIDKDRFSYIIGLFLLNSERNNVFYDAAVKRNIEVLPIRSTYQVDPSVVSKIGKIIRTRNIHILHAHEYKSDIIGFLASRAYRIPLVTTIHGWISNTFKSRLYLKLQGRLLRYFDRVIAVSPSIRDRLREMSVSDRRIVLLYNAIVVENYQRDAFPAGYIRERFKLPDGSVLIGNIGRLSPEKGQRDFLTAAREVCRTNERAYFVIVGDGPTRRALEQYAEELSISDRVLFTGHLQDVRPVYRDLDVLALTSHTEGFPNVVLESLCMETPVLATDVGGVRDIVADKETGVLVPPGNPTAIAEGLGFLLADPDRALRTARSGRALVQERFHFSQRVRRLETLYEDVIQQSGTAV